MEQIELMTLGESCGLVDKAEDSKLSDCGLEPLGQILDGVYCIGKNKLRYPNVAHHQKIYI
jgi:hypothetical protein